MNKRISFEKYLCDFNASLKYELMLMAKYRVIIYGTNIKGESILITSDDNNPFNIIKFQIIYNELFDIYVISIEKYLQYLNTYKEFLKNHKLFIKYKESNFYENFILKENKEIFYNSKKIK